MEKQTKSIKITYTCKVLEDIFHWEHSFRLMYRRACRCRHCTAGAGGSRRRRSRCWGSSRTPPRGCRWSPGGRRTACGAGWRCSRHWDHRLLWHCMGLCTVHYHRLHWQHSFCQWCKNLKIFINKIWLTIFTINILHKWYYISIFGLIQNWIM